VSAVREKDTVEQDVSAVREKDTVEQDVSVVQEKDTVVPKDISVGIELDAE
jgi:hypothetical protein